MSFSYLLEIPEPKATGNIIQDQLDRLKELWERVAADDSWGNVRVLPSTAYPPLR